MHLQIKEPVMKKETKKTRERKHKDGVANQLSSRKMKQEPPGGSVVLNFEPTTGSDLKGAMDEAKSTSLKNAIKALTEKVRKALERGDTLETIKHNLANDYPQIPEDKIPAILNSIIAKTPASKTTAEPAPAPKADKEDPSAAATVTTVFQKMMDRFNGDKDGALKEASRYVTEVDLLATAVKRSPATTAMPFNSNRADHYAWIAAQVKKHGADKVTAAVKKIYEKNGGIHLQVNQKLLVKP